MNPPSEDIKDYMESSSIGLGTFAATSGWSIQIDEMPNSPDTCILITDSVPDDKPAPNYDYSYPTVQVIVRGTQGGYLTAYEKAEDIKDALHGVNGEEINGARYIQILCAIDIMSLGKDENDRPQLSINFNIHRTEA